MYPNNEVAYDQILSPQKVKHHRVFGKPIGDEKKGGRNSWINGLRNTDKTKTSLVTHSTP